MSKHPQGEKEWKELAFWLMGEPAEVKALVKSGMTYRAIAFKASRRGGYSPAVNWERMQRDKEDQL